MAHRYVLLGVLVFVVAISGCYYPQGEEVSVSFHGSLTVSDSTFEMEGHVSTGGGIPEEDIYRDVSINLYSENKQQILSRTVGDLNANHGRLNVSFESSDIPYYVTIESPDFWEEPVGVDYYVFDNDTEKYTVFVAGSKEELPVSD